MKDKTKINALYFPSKESIRTVVPFNGFVTLMIGQLVNNEFLKDLLIFLSFYESC